MMAFLSQRAAGALPSPLEGEGGPSEKRGPGEG